MKKSRSKDWEMAERSAGPVVGRREGQSSEGETMGMAEAAGMEAEEGVGERMVPDSMVSVKSNAAGMVAERAGSNHRLLYIWILKGWRSGFGIGA